MANDAGMYLSPARMWSALGVVLVLLGLAFFAGYTAGSHRAPEPIDCSSQGAPCARPK
jgi:hypothetical protein